MPKRHQSNNTGSNAQRKDVKSKARNQITSSSSLLSAPTSSRVVITSNNKQSIANSGSRFGKSNNVKQSDAVRAKDNAYDVDMLTNVAKMAKRLVSPKAAKGKEISDNECEDKKGYKVHKHISKL
ncbi:hypothetical protein O3M35_000006 [Rhynocoris fuscipes]|uniref:Uncharacterized protein n=1 Tax=Rhynocoris fuscipes TaxID=488301 RepID=A0AAW1DM03_9HEMI